MAFVPDASVAAAWLLPDEEAAVADAALQWWRGERERNDSVYLHVPEQEAEDYAATAARLPDEAFTDDNDTDLRIYADGAGPVVDGSRGVTSADR